MSSNTSLSPLSDEQKAEIKEMICDILETDEEEVTETSHFIEEHGMDSLLAIEIVAALEKRLNLTIEQESMSLMANLEGVYAVVEQATRN